MVSMGKKDTNVSNFRKKLGITRQRPSTATSHRPAHSAGPDRRCLRNVDGLFTIQGVAEA
jgi:hypothetical protein